MPKYKATIEELVKLIKEEIPATQKMIKDNIRRKEYGDINHDLGTIAALDYIMYVIENGVDA